MRARFCGIATALIVACLASHAGAQENGWPTFGYTLSNIRHVGFSQIDARTVHALAPAWKYRTGVYGAFETSPVVVGRRMYITTGADHAVVALDAATGVTLWRYQAAVGPVPLCCGTINRGVAVDAGKVFVATLDDKLIALDARTGAKIWVAQVADPASSVSETMSPLAWHGKVFIGSSGGEFSIRGSFSAYSQDDGRRIWRWWSVSPGWEGRYVNQVQGMPLGRDIARERREARAHSGAWRRGGGPIWMTPAVDPSRSTIYLSVGNPAGWPDSVRPGDNLYTSSIVALDADTGKMRWFFQEVPHDAWDYDAASPAVLLRAKDDRGRMVDALGEAGKTGWFYVLDRASGKPIRIASIVPQRDPFKRPTPAGVTVMPSGYGGAVAPVSYDPQRRWVFVQAKQGTFFKRLSDQAWSPVGPSFEILSAIDVDTGRTVWRKVIGDGDSPNRTEGPLSTADLVFIGQEDGGAFQARSATSGALLWSYQTSPGGESEPDAPARPFMASVRDMLSRLKRWLLHRPAPNPSRSRISASPIAYVVDGREYVAIASGAGYRTEGSPGDTLYVFALP